jgi:signal transduction histidine kinase
MTIAYQDANIFVLGLAAARVGEIRDLLMRNGFRRVRGFGDRRSALAGVLGESPDLILVCGAEGEPADQQLLEDVVTLEKESYVAVLSVTPNFDHADLLERARSVPAMRLIYREMSEEKARLEAEAETRAAEHAQTTAALKAAEMMLAAQLAESEDKSRAKSDFIANLSHEFRTPLNSILGFSEMIARGAFGPHASPKYAEYGEDIHNAAQHLLDLVNDVLDLSRAEADRLDLEFTEVDARNTIDSAVRMLHDKARAKGLTLRVDVAPNFPRLRTDERRLRQVVINILGNAIKFTPPGGSVAVKAGVDPVDGAFIIVVSDTGVGIDPAELPQVLNRFGPVRSRKEGNEHGTGLGLPLTRKIVAALGGNLEIRSERGKGTAVTLRFPTPLIVEAEKPAAPAQQPARPRIVRSAS